MNSTKPYLAVIAGFIASSLAPPVLLALFAPLSGEFDVKSFVGSFAVALPFSIFANIFLGLPVFLALKRFGAIRLWSTALAGVLLGVVLAVVIRLPSRFDSHDLMTLVPLALLSALTFWSVWKLMSPR